MTPAAGTATPGTGFLSTMPGFAAMFPNARLIVEIALGALPTADVSSWSWTDITTDVQQHDDHVISISPMGVQDQSLAIVSAQCGLTVDNRAGNYSLGPQSINYPYIRQGLPIRVSLSLDGTPNGAMVVFWGQFTSTEPSFDSTGRWATVDVIANGTLNRVQLGQPPSTSPLRRSILSDTPTPIAYWPCDDAVGSTVIASAIPAISPMAISGTVTLAADNQVPGSFPVLTLDPGGQIQSSAIPYTFTGQWQNDFHVFVPAAPTNDTTVAQWRLNGTAVLWKFIISGGGASYRLNAVAADGTSLVAMFVGGSPPGIVGQWTHWSICAQQSGGNVNVRVVAFPTLGGQAGVGTASYAGTVGTKFAYTAMINIDGTGSGITGMGVQQVVLWDAFNHTEVGNAAFGFVGETTTARLTRIGMENGIPIQIIGTSTQQMGAQQIDTVFNTLTSIGNTEQGILGDGLGPGVYMVCRSALYNQTPALTLDAPSSDFGGEFKPIDDTTYRLNRATVTRTGGSSATFEDASGPLGTGKIGVFDQTPISEVNARRDTQILGYAAWLVGKGTVEGYRYPNLEMDWRRRPALALQWLQSFVGSEIDLSNVGSWISQHPAGLLALLAVGSSTTLTNMEWSSALNLTPAAPYRSGLVGVAGTFTGARVGKPAGNAKLAINLNPGDTSVAVNVDPLLWATSASLYPLDFNIGGWQVNVSGVSGVATPQTFTFTSPFAGTHTVPAGSNVGLWSPARVVL
jgi:hypothetical protein